MIVRDEAAIIERSLASVGDLVDRWVICDTGSTDGTQELVRAALAGLPGELHERPWRDFGWNRTELLRLATGAADYLLLLDADHTVRVEGPLPRLVADAYLVRHDGALEYWVARLIRSSPGWRFQGRTHEYLTRARPHTEDRLPALVVEDHADGSSRRAKLERDRPLLEAELEADPANERALFYLAQTARELGDEARAIELYGRRVDLGGWPEEVFYAAYQRGRLLARRDPEAGFAALADAAALRPTRAEPLYELAALMRERGAARSARDYALQGLALGYPADDVLFVHRPVYEWGLALEYTLAAHAIGDWAQALEASERLLEEGVAPEGVQELLRETRRDCLERLGRAAGHRPRSAQGELLRTLAPSVEVAELRLDVPRGWSLLNPSIAEDDDGFRVVVRSSNYRAERGGYVLPAEETTFRTQNYLVALDRELRLTEAVAVGDLSTGPPLYPSRVAGYEDCRLVRCGDTWVATANVGDRNPDERWEVALLTLDDAIVTRVDVLHGPHPERDQKNWMPFVAGGELLLVYACSPTVVLGCDLVTGAVSRVTEHRAPAVAARVRGGSQGLPVDDGFLFVVHETLGGPGERIYVHRLVLLDAAFRLRALSRRFRFAGTGLEFCAGLARHGSDLLLSFGVADGTAALAAVDAGQALALLESTAPSPKLKGAGRSATMPR
jgi:Glycosyl transferase family 2